MNRAKRVAFAVVCVSVLVGGFGLWTTARDTTTTFGPALPEVDQAVSPHAVTVQMRWKIEDYRSVDSFRERIDGLIEAGMKQAPAGSTLLFAFPEDIGTPLLLLGEYDVINDKKTLAEAMEAVVFRHPVRVMYYKFRYGVSPARALMLAKAKTAGQAYVETFSQLAKKHGVYVVAGSAPLPDFPLSPDGATLRYAISGGEVYNVSYFFGPDGRIIGRQRKVHLVPLESEEGLNLSPAPLEDLRAFDTPFGKVGIAICWDAFHEDAITALLRQGADILVQPSANPGAWNEEQQKDWLRGAWTVLQEHGQFRVALNPMMTGNLFDIVFEGQSTVVKNAAEAPGGPSFPLAPVAGGFAAMGKQADGEDLLVTPVD